MEGTFPICKDCHPCQAVESRLCFDAASSLIFCSDMLNGRENLGSTNEMKALKLIALFGRVHPQSCKVWERYGIDESERGKKVRAWSKCSSLLKNCTGIPQAIAAFKRVIIGRM
jgi:hypothetical protein